MLSVGLATLASCGYDIKNAVHGNKTMNILCIGHGGGSLPLFLASKIKGEGKSPTHSACAFLLSVLKLVCNTMNKILL